MRRAIGHGCPFRMGSALTDGRAMGTRTQVSVSETPTVCAQPRVLACPTVCA